MGTDHKPLLAFFRKVDPKPLDHIVNKRLRKYVSEIGELHFSIFHIPGAANFLSDRGSRFPTGIAGNDRGDALGGQGDIVSALGGSEKVGANTAEILANTSGSWLPNVLPRDVNTDYPSCIQVFAYGAKSPSSDAEVQDDGQVDSDDYVTQALSEVAEYLSISAEKRVSVAMTIDRLRQEIQSDALYKYLRQIVIGNVRIDKLVGELSVYNCHRDDLTVGSDGLIWTKDQDF